MKLNLKYIGIALAVIGSIVFFQNCGKGFSNKEDAAEFSSSESGKAQLNEGNQGTQNDLNLFKKADRNAYELDETSINELAQTNAETSGTKVGEIRRKEQCTEALEIPLSLNQNETRPFLIRYRPTIENGRSIDNNKFIKIRVCAKFPTQNADYQQGEIGYYLKENIGNACPESFHPIEIAELRHISQNEEFKKKYGNMDRLFGQLQGFFRDGQYVEENGPFFWTHESRMNNKVRFAKYPNEFNVESESGARLALPVACVQDHIFSRNGLSDLQLAGCDFTVERNGLRICHESSELFKNYSTIFNIPSEYGQYISEETKKRAFRNYSGLNFHRTNRNQNDEILKVNESYDLKRVLENLTCPSGFELPRHEEIKKLVSEENANDVFCIKSDESLANKEIELMGCSQKVNVDGKLYCQDRTLLDECPSGFHFFNVNDYNRQKSLLFEIDKNGPNRKMQFPLSPSYFVKGNDDMVYVEGLAKPLNITYSWIHNGEKTSALPDGARRGWRLVGEDKMRDPNSYRTLIPNPNVKKLCVKN